VDDLTDRYARAIEELDRHVHAVRDDQWSNPTPCTDWDVRALVNHIVYETLWMPPLIEGKTLEEVGDRFDGDQLGQDPAGAWEEAAATALAALAPEGVTERTVQTSGGPTPAEHYLTELLFDGVIHGWDLAQGIGVAHTIDPATAADLLTWVQAALPALEASGAFAAPVPTPDDADASTRLIALSGRTP
jgi:uncharacterized protein (TIGR03086 family)